MIIRRGEKRRYLYCLAARSRSLRGGARSGKPCAHTLPVRMTDLVEYGECLVPDSARSTDITDAKPDIAKAAEAVCLVEPVVALPVDLDGALVALDRLAVVT